MPKSVKFLVTTATAWLALSGLIDALVEWIDWYEQGVMQHWRSVKVWVSAVFFDWLPFEVPHWFFDYIVLGVISLKAEQRRRPSVRPRLSLDDYGEIWRHGLLRKFLKSVVETAFAVFFSHALFTALRILLWPILIVVFIVLFARTLGSFFSDPGSAESRRIRDVDIREQKAYLQRLMWYCLSFIPFLFVTSKFLYQLG